MDPEAPAPALHLRPPNGGGALERRGGAALPRRSALIDAASDAFVAELVAAVAGTRTLLPLNYRPEYQRP
jgi:hypothetical protein